MGRLLAIGDIHGRLDKLLGLLDRLRPADSDKLVFLGDYIDRGPHSREVVDTLLELRAERPETVFLKGNHEAMLLDNWLADDRPEYYLMNGGQATLESYGQAEADPARTRLPAGHLAFFRSLASWRQEDGCLFVHGGLRPGRPLAEQTERDLLWLREEFYQAEADWPWTIVFGHTPFPEVFRKGNIRGIDTGAAYGGPLTCLILPDDQVVQA